MDNDIADLLQAGDVFILPSVAEGLGLSAIEAQACGVPCVVSTGVPRAADVSGAVSFVGLEESLDKWVDAVFQTAQMKIEYPAGCIQQAGYRISYTAQGLYDIFMGE